MMDQVHIEAENIKSMKEELEFHLSLDGLKKLNPKSLTLWLVRLILLPRLQIF